MGCRQLQIDCHPLSSPLSLNSAGLSVGTRRFSSGVVHFSERMASVTQNPPLTAVSTTLHRNNRGLRKGVHFRRWYPFITRHIA
jgi:hypothetical protein